MEELLKKQMLRRLKRLKISSLVQKIIRNLRIQAELSPPLFWVWGVHPAYFVEYVTREIMSVISWYLRAPAPDQLVWFTELVLRSGCPRWTRTRVRYAGRSSWCRDTLDPSPPGCWPQLWEMIRGTCSETPCVSSCSLHSPPSHHICVLQEQLSISRFVKYSSSSLTVKSFFFSRWNDQKHLG